ncbi:IS200/IS605 family transposase [Algoriphagus yeomjeoni]|uniref:REP element-mobilizing transposase RayT n=1 Tax=Algoriphagus yeomjeoni TaxID=291403 RepID=A0A327PDS2_9BACT|nr:IS200/IS605 family transposase [Algoriphagus yeomjeoni]RAI89374.1 REP element-mobilizing transposase RayT [Algoriphagus yeomjeoni]
MAGTFSQVYLQYVFAVKGRENLLLKPWREEVFKYISGIIEGKKQKSIIVNGVSDHVHVFVGLKPSMSISDLIRDVKNNSSNFINKRGFVQNHFDWQDGYGVFSYSHSQLNQVYKYILNQENHHKKVSFRDEYYAFLKKFEIDHEEKYLFDFLDDTL